MIEEIRLVSSFIANAYERIGLLNRDNIACLLKNYLLVIHDLPRIAWGKFYAMSSQENYVQQSQT